MTASPWRSALVHRAARAGARSTPGKVARMVRRPTRALISVDGPSATIRPLGHQHDPVGVGVGLLEVVRGEHDRLSCAATPRIAGQNSRRPSTSIAAVGSSRMRRSGLPTSAVAKRTRCAWPPESFSRSTGRPTRRCRSGRAPRRRRAASGSTTPSGDQLAHLEVVERRPGLEHAADPAAPHRHVRRQPKTETRPGRLVG